MYGAISRQPWEPIPIHKRTTSLLRDNTNQVYFLAEEEKEKRAAGKPREPIRQ